MKRKDNDDLNVIIDRLAAASSYGWEDIETVHFDGIKWKDADVELVRHARADLIALEKEVRAARVQIAALSASLRGMLTKNFGK